MLLLTFRGQLATSIFWVQEARRWEAENSSAAHGVISQKTLLFNKIHVFLVSLILCCKSSDNVLYSHVYVHHPPCILTLNLLAPTTVGARINP